MQLENSQLAESAIAAFDICNRFATDSLGKTRENMQIATTFAGFSLNFFEKRDK